MVKDALAYIDQYEEHDHAIPSVAGLAKVLDVSRSTLYKWSGEGDQFSDILDKINETQEIVLLSKGLKNEFNSNITKLALGKHGYHDKIDQKTEMDVYIGHEDAEVL